jgi:hypothetical protein
MSSLYLRFANPEVADENAMLLYGISTTRNADDNKSIGKFGSGAKNAVSTCLREGAPPTFFLSTLRMDYSAKPLVVDGYTYHQIVVHFSGAKNSTRALDYVIEHGQDDWCNISMALREFASNAIDGAIKAGSWEKAKIEIVPENKVRAKSGWTQVFVPLTPEVQEWFLEMPKRFLHFSEPETVGYTSMLPKKDRNIFSNNRGPLVYRRGVLVRELVTDLPSLFDYQLEDLEIDEARNCDEYKIRASCSKALADAPVETLRTLFEAMSKGKEFWELNIDRYYLCSDYASDKIIQTRKINWQLAWSEACGDSVASSSLTFERVMAKGRNPIVVGSSALLEAIRMYEVPNDFSLMGEDEKHGLETLPPTQEVLEVVNDIWQKIVSVKKNYGKEMPECHCFRKLSNAGEIRLGFWERGANKILFNIDFSNGKCDELYSIAVEEIAHYVTEASDFTRDFQNYLVSLCAALARR